MRRLPSWGWITGIVVVAVLCGGGFGWWISHRNAPDLNFDPNKMSESAAPEIAPVPQPATPAPDETAKKVEEPSSEPASMPNENVADTNVTADQAWQNELDGVLLSESSDEQKVSRLLQLLPT